MLPRKLAEIRRSWPADADRLVRGRSVIVRACALLGLFLGPGHCVAAGAQTEPGSPLMSPNLPMASAIQPDDDLTLASAQRVDDLVASRLKATNVPAAGVIVLLEGRVVAVGVAGERAQGSGVVATVDDLWHIGSCTKAMTASLIARLVERGELAWDEPLSSLTPRIWPSAAGAIHESWRPVTLRHLTTNTSGAPHDIPPAAFLALRQGGEVVEVRNRFAAGELRRPTRHKPGTRDVYSNTGFIIAGHLAERATGLSWEELMRREVFGPLGMASAGFGAPGSASSVDQPRGHAPRLLGKPRPIPPDAPESDNPAALGPAGTVHLSMLDWARFVRAHLRAEPGAAEAAQSAWLTPDSIAFLHASELPLSDQGDGYAAGWMTTRRPWARGGNADDVGRTLTHAGSNTIWFAVAWLAPERDFAVLVVSNSGSNGAARLCDTIASDAISRFLPRPTPNAPGKNAESGAGR